MSKKSSVPATFFVDVVIPPIPGAPFGRSVRVSAHVRFHPSTGLVFDSSFDRKYGYLHPGTAYVDGVGHPELAFFDRVQLHPGRFLTIQKAV